MSAPAAAQPQSSAAASATRRRRRRPQQRAALAGCGGRQHHPPPTPDMSRLNETQRRPSTGRRPTAKRRRGGSPSGCPTRSRRGAELHRAADGGAARSLLGLDERRKRACPTPRTRPRQAPPLAAPLERWDVDTGEFVGQVSARRRRSSTIHAGELICDERGPTSSSRRWRARDPRHRVGGRRPPRGHVPPAEMRGGGKEGQEGESGARRRAVVAAASSSSPAAAPGRS